MKEKKNKKSLNYFFISFILYLVCSPHLHIINSLKSIFPDKTLHRDIIIL